MSPPISLGVPTPACHDGAMCEGVQKATNPRALESPRKQCSTSSAFLKRNATLRLLRAQALIESGVMVSDSSRESRSITNLLNSTKNINNTAQAGSDYSPLTTILRLTGAHCGRLSRSGRGSSPPCVYTCDPYRHAYMNCRLLGWGDIPQWLHPGPGFLVGVLCVWTLSMDLIMI